ncbi:MULTISPECIES: hypothetical protein [Xanthomonas]|uniref:Tail fiber protein n=1 Tax=Xanthomonas axonopodis pv. cajani TaxID=487827 RepID=A0ABX3M5H8_9XANT|nr:MULTISPECIES: hypothetical protein [Xanthomonas]MBO9859293.1 hypothetical protein [Xanthomonas sp. A1809]MDC9651535.1 hypothetical protein [Xanthomonas perforans]MDC9658264.1 hypothetical protein [Xanthomonas perforans]MDC9679047.1 hypothetical protein [Xanthomonas perforans]MDC9679964.1 hypothetical protein [Xanthomonas perforans]
MALGVRIRPEGGNIIQIDTRYENLALKQKGTVTAVGASSGGAAQGIGFATVTVGGGNSPLIAVTCASFVGLRNRSQNGSTFTFELVCETANTAIQYYVFDTTDVAQMAFVTSKGVRFRDPATGRIAFDSRYKYMRVIGRMRATAGTAQTDFPTQADGVAIALGHTGASYTIVSGVIGGGPRWAMDRLAYVAGVRYTPGTASAKGINTYYDHAEGNQGSPPAPPGTFGTMQVDCLLLNVRNY